jgi:hypothetical protein
VRLCALDAVLLGKQNVVAIEKVHNQNLTSGKQARVRRVCNLIRARTLCSRDKCRCVNKSTTDALIIAISGRALEKSIILSPDTLVSAAGNLCGGCPQKCHLSVAKLIVNVETITNIAHFYLRCYLPIVVWLLHQQLRKLRPLTTHKITVNNFKYLLTK